MDKYVINTKINKKILALGAESAGNFSVFDNGHVFHSENFGDLLDEKNYAKFQKSILLYLKNKNIIPDIIITDLHPNYKTTIWGENLSKKYNAKHFKIQHHHAHIFSVLDENMLESKTFYGIAMDGTGYGVDGKIWGGEVFEVGSKKLKVKRIGHLENQILIGNELAIREPARMLISILNKFLNKKEVFNYLKKYYTKNEFELLYSQLQQNFNCSKTSSTGRVLDAVSVLLGFSKNERKLKHGPTYLLEENSTKPFDIESVIKKDGDKLILQTTPLFEYLIKNLQKDKKRLAATSELYVAKGLYEIILKSNPLQNIYKIYFGGGLSNNKIISSYLLSKGLITNKKVLRGDAGLSLGQIFYYLSTNTRD